MDDEIRVTLRLPLDVYEALVATANVEGRSLNGQIVLALRDFVRRREEWGMDSGEWRQLPRVTRVRLGSMELVGARVWAARDYSTDSGFLTAVYISDQPRWPVGARELLTIERSGADPEELMVQVEEERYLGGQSKSFQVRFVIIGGQACYVVEQLLGIPDSLRTR